MPPKGSRGGRTTRGGRGRGGAGNAPSITPNIVESQPTNHNSSAEASQDVSMQDAPVLSSAPTSAPAETSSNSVAPARGRFKPKAVRRDQTERQRIADEERQRMEEREKAAEVASSRGRGRGGFRGTRGRGSAMGKRMVTIGTASGLFSQLPQGIKKGDLRAADLSVLGSSGYEGPRGIGDPNAAPGRAKTNQASSSNSDNRTGGTAGGTGTGARGGSGVAGSSDEVKIKKELPDPVYPGLAEEGYYTRGIDIERINVVSDDEEEDISTGKGKGRASEFKKKGLKPIRIPREEHKERVTVVNTEASAPEIREEEMAEDEDDSGLFVPQDLEAERLRRNRTDLATRDATGKPWSGVWGDSEDVKIKPDPDLPGTMEIDNIPASEPPASLPTESVKKDGPTPKLKPRTRRASGMRAKKPVLQTDEDKAEWERHLEDVAIITEELASIRTIKKAETTDASGDIKMEEDMESSEVKDKEGRLYLFQFPPTLPPLYNPDKIKEEPVDDEPDVVQTSSKPAPGISGSSTAPIDLSKTRKPTDFVVEGVKAEPDDNAWKKEDTTTPIVPEEGYIGKLIVRESGKVEMSWGGTSFELNRGAQHSFLMTGLLMDGLGKSPEDDVTPKAASSLGPIMGKFIVTPDWDKMF